MIRMTFLVAVLQATQAGPAPRPASDHAATIDSLVSASLRETGVPGIAVAVVHRGDTIALKGYGLADVEHGVPVSDRTVFRIGSVTKQFTSAAVMKLVEEGRIRLDATIGDYLPDYPGPGRRVTIHQLLNHTSGIPSYTGLGPAFWEKSRLDLTHAQMLELFAQDSLEFEPGTRWAYNNSGYYLLGMIIEAVTGASYGEHLARTQFQPLGLTQTMYCDERAIVPHRAEGYQLDRGGVVNAEPLSMNPPGAAGALCSTTRDLVRWSAKLAAGDVVRPASYATMTAPTRLADGRTQDYGYGLAPDSVAGRPVIAHSGGINGFTSFLAHYPADDLTIAVLANAGMDTGALAARIVRRVLGLPEPAAPAEQPLPQEERARYVGTYDLAPAVPMQITIFEQGERLMAQGEGQGAIPLRYQGGTRFDGPPGSDIRLEFIIEDGRAVAFTLLQGGGEMRARRIE